MASFTDVDLLALVGFVSLAVGLACYFVLGTVRAQPVQVQLPITGRWVALNSPAKPGAQSRTARLWPDLRAGPGPRAAGPTSPALRLGVRFPASFGFPRIRPAGASSCRRRGGAGARPRPPQSQFWAGIAYLLLEGTVRELLGPGRILGNHIVLDLGNGVYAALAHLRQNSAQVKTGDSVRAGQHIADCGNSGNSTEPHLHLQLMDHPWVAVAAGLPVEFDSYEIEGSRRSWRRR